MISAVAERYGVHAQTLRLWERHGLICPSRTEGKTRLYTDDDLERLEVILQLTRELGVNLAGVEIILNMRHKMEAMQTEFNSLLDFLASKLNQTGEIVDEGDPSFALVHCRPSTLRLLKEKLGNSQKEPNRGD